VKRREAIIQLYQTINYKLFLIIVRHIIELFLSERSSLLLSPANLIAFNLHAINLSESFFGTSVDEACVMMKNLFYASTEFEKWMQEERVENLKFPEGGKRLIPAYSQPEIN
jgi:hypothetical protein